MAIEAGGGTTFNRNPVLHDAPIAYLSLITQADSRFPTEWNLGYLFPQEKNDSIEDNDDSTAWLGIGKRFRWKALILGFGLVAVNRINKRISGHVDFRSLAGFQAGPLVALVQHITNAGLHGDNDGETFATLGFRYSFGE